MKENTPVSLHLVVGYEEGEGDHVIFLIEENKLFVFERIDERVILERYQIFGLFER